MDDPRLDNPTDEDREFTPYAPVPTEAPPKPEDAPPNEPAQD
jgi:hypothetical protein